MCTVSSTCNLPSPYIICFIFNLSLVKGTEAFTLFSSPFFFYFSCQKDSPCLLEYEVIYDIGTIAFLL